MFPLIVPHHLKKLKYSERSPGVIDINGSEQEQKTYNRILKKKCSNRKTLYFLIINLND